MFDSKSYFLFPSQVMVTYSKKFLLYREKLIDLCYDHMVTDPEKRLRSNRLGYQSKFGEFHKKEEFKFLFDDINDLIIHCLNEEFHAKTGSRYNIGCSILNVMPKGSFNHGHIHPGTQLVGVFYIKVPQNAGSISFVCPNEYLLNRLVGHRKKEYVDQNNLQPNFEIVPQEGMFLLFPSTLTHRVEANLSNDDRISMGIDLHLIKNDEDSPAYGW